MSKGNEIKVCNLADSSTFIASQELVNKAKEKNAKQYLNVCYSDYGGTFFDKVLISYFKKEHPNNIVVENAGWNGENAFIFGDILDEFLKETNNYLLGFEFIEDEFTEIQQNEYKLYADDLIKNEIFSENERDLIYNYLEDNAHVDTFGIDVNDDALIEAINEQIKTL